MKNNQITWRILLVLLVVQTLCFIVPQTIFCQTETLDIVQYTPPKGWTKTAKEGATVYTDINKSTNTFCLLTVYASTSSSGDPQKDFTDEWNRSVVKLFKAEENPKTESQNTPDGWKAIAGGAQIDLDGVKSYAILTVFSGFEKTASVLVVSNDQSYLAQVEKFIDGIKLDKTDNATNSPVNPIEWSDILREYRDNRVAADARYEGKRITIVGPMDFVLAENGQPMIRMAVPAWSGMQMFCIFPASQKPELAKLKADQKVVIECTVRGKVGGYDEIGRITLDRCLLK